MVELGGWRAALALPGRAAAVSEVVRVVRLWATEGSLYFIGKDICGLRNPTPLSTATGKDTVKAEQGREEMPTDILANGHPHTDQGAIWNVSSLVLQPFKAFWEYFDSNYNL